MAEEIQLAKEKLLKFSKMEDKKYGRHKAEKFLDNYEIRLKEQLQDLKVNEDTIQYFKDELVFRTEQYNLRKTEIEKDMITKREIIAFCKTALAGKKKTSKKTTPKTPEPPEVIA